MQAGTEVSLNPAMVGVAAGEGDVNWDLPKSMQYKEGTEVTANCSVVNSSSATHVYALIFQVLNKDKNIIYESLLEFDGYQAFQLAPNHALEFSITFSLTRKDVYVALSLWVCRQSGASWVLDHEVDRVECFLGTTQLDLSSMMNMMMMVMVMGMMVPMISKMGE